MGAKRARRVDGRGRAFSGSQLQVQIYVNRRAKELNRAIAGETEGALDPAKTPIEYFTGGDIAGFSDEEDASGADRTYAEANLKGERLLRAKDRH